MTLRVGLVGCGAIARRAHLPALRAAGDVDVVRFASRSMSSASSAREEWGSGQVDEDWRRLVEAADVDAVDICSPNRSHAPIAIAAAQAGKHVLVEKPIACTLAEADAMLDAASRAGVVLGVAHNLRDAKPFFTARSLVAEGAIGTVTGFRAAIGHAGPRGWAPEATWFFDPAQAGGGALLDLGIHVADLVRWVLDDDAIEVTGMVSSEQGGVDVAGQALLRMGRGALGSIHASWRVHPGPDHQLTLFGSEATFHLDSRTAPTILRAGADPHVVPLVGPAVNVYKAWVQACLGQGAPAVSGADGRAALAIIEAAYGR